MSVVYILRLSVILCVCRLYYVFVTYTQWFFFGYTLCLSVILFVCLLYSVLIGYILGLSVILYAFVDYIVCFSVILCVCQLHSVFFGYTIISIACFVIKGVCIGYG